jgi:transposase
MSHASILCLADLPPPSTRPVPRPSRGDGWNALADVEVFIFAVEAELEAMDQERVGVHRRGRKPDLVLRRRVIGLIWMLTFGGMQWRIAGLLSGIPFTTLHTSFARWSRLGLWRRLGQRLAFDWRLACGDEVLPSAVVVDSRSLRSSPSAWARGFDGGKLVKGIKLFVASDKHGFCNGPSVVNPPER